MKLFDFMENNPGFTYYLWYGSHKAFNVAFPIIAVGLPQIIRPHKNTTWSLFPGPV